MSTVKAYMVTFNDDGSIDSLQLVSPPPLAKRTLQVFATSAAKASDAAKTLYSLSVTR